MPHRSKRLALIRAGIDTYRQPVVYMRADCDLCRSEGFSSLARVEITLGARSIVATLNVVTEGAWLPPGAAALSEAAWEALSPEPGAMASFSHPEPPVSADAIRAKVYGRRLNQAAFRDIVRDIVGRRLSELELAAFVAACAGDRLDAEETVALTRAMVETGRRLEWGEGMVLDKHCVGGLPGNRTTPIVVAIVAASGRRIPKTSSRAITSPAGTADTMETMAPVALSAEAMRKVVEAEGGCVVWGGGLDLAPADDLLIRVERPLDFDSEGQMVASILSKKAAAGSTHVLIDMPVGPTAKVRSSAAAHMLEARLLTTAEALGLNARVRLSDGSGPVGRGIGPALEAHDVLAVLRRAPHAPQDLRERALDIAGALLDMAAEAEGGPAAQGRETAQALLDSGAAEAKFMAICAAQGGFSEPGRAAHRRVERAPHAGAVAQIDNRRIARIAKLAGAPGRKNAGVLLHASLGQRVDKGDPLYEIHAETPGELEWAAEYAGARAHPFRIEAEA
ncbi:thymidine phosphorylase family protein [Oceanicella actignis]|uniref:thymidine phosphorylase family protein n=1 Tax=Oceanicella actignis TaxID=1189325 RepID=UPI0011E6D4AB|nr:thymidine phosphorylase family protein [Oceanicella actignis]TYO91176.1 thymidine phosphorylase [Oceanicella actignis]